MNSVGFTHNSVYLAGEQICIWEGIIPVPSAVYEMFAMHERADIWLP